MLYLSLINLNFISDECILNEILKCLSVCDKNCKAFVIVLTILSDKVDSRLIIKCLPEIAENLLQLMSSNNSVSNITLNKTIHFLSLFTYIKLLSFSNV